MLQFFESSYTIVMLEALTTKLTYLWSAPAETTIDPAVLNFYRIMLILGEALLTIIALYLSAATEVVNWTLHLGFTYIVLSFLLCVSSFLFEPVKNYIGELACGISIIFSIYLAIILYASNLGIFELLFAITSLSFGCALYHKIKLIITFSATTIIALNVAAYLAPAPLINPNIVTLVFLAFGVTAGYLRSALVLAKMRKQQWDAINNIWFEESADGLLFGHRVSGEVLKANARIFELFECDNGPQCVYLLRQAFHATSPERELRELLHEVVTDTDWQEDLLFTTARGNTFWGRFTMNRVLVNDRTDLLLVKITDVTQTITHAKELEEAKDLAEAAVEVRTRFLANMSHEIRTPMNGVIGMTSLLRETELTMQQENFLETIRNSGESLLTIINEILDFSKLDASQVQLEQQAFDLEVCASEAMDIIFPTAAAKGIELLLDYKVHSSRLWIGDATRIRQVMVNLLSNAVKFTEAGQIIVTVRGDNQAFDDSNDAEKTEHEDNAKLHFEIEDSGIGITPLQLETLFDPFIQADVSTTRKYGGTGLGLSICKGLIELMGGQITTISSPGRGSIFKFDLYLKTSRNKVRELTNSYPGKRAVIIHDKVASLENLKRYLELVNVTVEGHHSLDSFIKSLDELNRNTEQNIYPDVIFTNQQVSTHDAEKLSCPILSIAAKQFSDQGGAAVASPMRLPIRPTELASLLSQVFISQNKIEVSQPSPKKVWDDLPIQGKSFLLAEDNVVNQQVAVQFLSKLGIRVDVVSNGKEAVEMMYQRNYDYIFMDLQMPEIDGLEATQLIRQMELPVQPYIIAMTANAMAEDKQVCLDIGMNDFISKPVRLDDMHSTLKQALNQTLNNHGDQLH